MSSLLRMTSGTGIAILCILAIGCRSNSGDDFKMVDNDPSIPTIETDPESGICVDLRKEFAPVYFDFDSYVLRPDALKTLRDDAEVMRKMCERGGMSLEITGHADERGTQEYNMALGQQRAEAVKVHLVRLGIYESAIRCVSFGEEKPAVEGHTKDAWSKNRRCELVAGFSGVKRRR
ncbi:MAG: OmpA family protein [bacterium]|nr:OmpA family protein [bacterium]